MIPPFNTSGVLPPFTGAGLVPGGANSSPYACAISEIYSRVATTPERLQIFSGLLQYRTKLTRAGLTGYQFIDGSFVEDCERVRARPPGDIDVVTFTPIPGVTAADKRVFMTGNPQIFDRSYLKKTYHCDAYLVDLAVPAHVVVPKACYWYGLLSHQRVTALWKGMLVVPLQSDDANIVIVNSTGDENAP